jgi:hypothetical protein
LFALKKTKMKKLELNQMEKIEGGVSKETWCCIGGAVGALAGAFAGGPVGALTVASCAAWILSC